VCSLTDNSSQTRCVIKSDGLAWCVGGDSYGQFTHDAGTSDIHTPAVQFDADTARTMAAGAKSACFVSCSTGATRCAGQGGNGQLGDGLDTNSASLVTVTGLDSDACGIIK
jgi:hypothetical protein